MRDFIRNTNTPVRQYFIKVLNIDAYLCCNMASLGHNELSEKIHSIDAAPVRNAFLHLT